MTRKGPKKSFKSRNKNSNGINETLISQQGISDKHNSSLNFSKSKTVDPNDPNNNNNDNNSNNGNNSNRSSIVDIDKFNQPNYRLKLKSTDLYYDNDERQSNTLSIDIMNDDGITYSKDIFGDSVSDFAKHSKLLKDNTPKYRYKKSNYLTIPSINDDYKFDSLNNIDKNHQWYHSP